MDLTKSKVRYALGLVITLLLSLGMNISVWAADITASFTDPNFLETVRDIISKPAPAPILDTDVESITNLDVSGKDIAGLKGIEHFVDLEHLDCSDNKLTGFDISKNTSLKTLICFENHIASADDVIGWDSLFTDVGDKGDGSAFQFNPQNPPPALPTVTSVTVTPATANVVKGATQQFTAAVAGTNNPPTSVTWEVTGGVTGTTISVSGLLTVAANETAATLTVKATSTHDATKFGTATVTINEPAPSTVTSVAVTPATANVVKGATQSFTAVVTGTNNPPSTVTWTVTGGVTGTAISAGGLLTVAAAETAATLTVRATSAHDTTKFGEATVTVTNPPITVTTVTITPTLPTVFPGNNLQFYVNVAGTGSPAQTVEWQISGNYSSSTTISETGLLRVASNETAASFLIRAISTVDKDKFGITTVYTQASSATTQRLSLQADRGGRIVRGTSGSYTPGTRITIEAEPDEDYEFDGWVTSHGGTFNNARNEQTTFTMPDGSTTVTARFKQVRGAGGGGSGSNTPPTSVAPPPYEPIEREPPSLPQAPAVVDPPAEYEPIPEINETIVIAYEPEWEIRTVRLNGARINMVQPPINYFGYTYIPLREVLQMCGFSAQWDGETRTATFKNGNERTVIEVTEGSAYFFKNGNAFRADAPAELINGYLMMPFKDILDSIGCVAYRDENNNFHMNYSLVSPN